MTEFRLIDAATHPTYRAFPAHKSQRPGSSAAETQLPVHERREQQHRLLVAIDSCVSVRDSQFLRPLIGQGEKSADPASHSIFGHLGVGEAA